MFNNRFIEYNKHDADWSKMISNEKPYYLVKFIDKKWADKLMDGEVFMRAIACFGDILRRTSDSQNEFRGDVLEGINYSFGNQMGLIDVLTYREKSIVCMRWNLMKRLRALLSLIKGYLSLVILQ